MNGTKFSKIKNNPYLNESIDIINNKKKGKNYKTASFELSRVVYDSNEFFPPDFIAILSKKIK